MKDLNITGIIGRLTSDSEIKSFENFDAIKFSIAVNNRGKKGEDGKYSDKTIFVNVKHSGKNLKKLNEMLTKGKTVSVEGFIDQDAWEKDGKKNYLTYVNADTIKLIGGTKEESPAAPKDEEPPIEYESSGSDFPEDIPF